MSKAFYVLLLTLTKLSFGKAIISDFYVIKNDRNGPDQCGLVSWTSPRKA